MKKLTVDVIIPTYHPDASFRNVLLKLAAQSYPAEHILIINTEESFWNPELAKGIPGAEVFHIDKCHFDHGATRDMGAGFSNADILIFMTQDALPRDEFLIQNLVREFDSSLVKIAYARQLPNEKCRVIEGYIRSYNYPPERCTKTVEDITRLGIKTFFCSNVCAAYDHQVYKELDGFPRPCIFNEDMIFAGKAVRLGYAIAYTPDACVYHSHNYTNRQQFHRNFDNGVSQAMHPEIFRGIRSEGEGIKMVRGAAAYLRSVRRGYLIPQLWWQSFCKFAGFRLGRIYRFLPAGFVKACSMNKGFWSYRNPEEIDEED